METEEGCTAAAIIAERESHDSHVDFFLAAKMKTRKIVPVVVVQTSIMQRLAVTFLTTAPSGGRR